MKALLLALLLASPVSAQSIHSTQAGEDYCSLRRSGVQHGSALRLAVRANRSPQRDEVVYFKGKPYPASVAAMVLYIFRVCPQSHPDLRNTVL